MILQKLLNRPKAGEPSSQFRHGSTYRRTAGVVVNEDTALTYSAVYLAVKIISETLAALPSNVFTRKPSSNDRKVARNHPLRNLLMYPNSEMTGFGFMSTFIGHAVLRGGGFAFIDRDKSNRPGELQLITPDRVSKGRSRETGQVVYEIRNGTAANSYYGDDQILHLPGMGFDGLTGYSVVSLAARSFGLGMAAEQFGASFYENGAQLGTVIEVPPEINLDEAGKDLLIDSFDEKHRGVKHHHRTAIIDAGMKIQSVGIPQKDAQFIESRKFSVTDVARWFNMPPHKLKDLERATFSNIEEQNIDFVQDTLMPWIVNLEQTINWKLIGKNNNRQFFKYNVNALMRGDAKSRAEYYKTRFNMGSLSINEIKALEDENGIGADGDKYFMQSAMTTIENIIDPPEPPAPVMPTAVPGGGEDESGSDDADEPSPQITDAASKIVFNISERVKRARKKGDDRPLIDVMKTVVDERRDYIETTIENVTLSLTDIDNAHTSGLVDLISETILANETEPLDELKTNLASDIAAYCAKITEKEATE